MDCRRVDNWLPAYLEDALPARRARAVAAHLEICLRCRRERRALETALAALDGVGRRTPSIDLWSSFAERLAAEETAASRTPRWRTPLLWRPLGAGVSLAVAVGACFAGLLLADVQPSSLPTRMPPSRRVAAMPKALPSAQHNTISVRTKGVTSGSVASKTLPELRSPEESLVLAPVVSPAVPAKPERVAVASSATTAKPAPPAAPPAVSEQEPGRLAALPLPVPPLHPASSDRGADLLRAAPAPGGELVSAADVLMEAQQNAACTQVANEVIALAEEFVRVDKLRSEQGEGRS